MVAVRESVGSDLKSIDPRKLSGVIELILRNKWIVMATFVTVMTLTALFLISSERVYRSEAMLFVRVGGKAVNLKNAANESLAVADSQQREVYAVAELLQSRLLAEKVVEHFGSDKILNVKKKTGGLGLSRMLDGLNDFNLNPLQKFSDTDSAINVFSKNLKVLPTKTSSVMSMSYQCNSSEEARDILAFVLKTATEEHFRVHRTSGSQEFFATQAERLRARLADLECKLRDFKNITGLASLDLQRAKTLELIGALEQDRILSSTQLDAMEAESKKRREHMMSSPTEVVTQRTSDQPNGIGQTLRSKLYDLESMELDQASRLTADHPATISTRERLAEARKLFDRQDDPVQLTAGINPSYQAAENAVKDREASIDGLKKRLDSLAEKLTTAKTEVVRLNAAEVELSELQREIELVRNNYRVYAENLEQARINEELEQAKLSGLSMMQPPTLSPTPVSPIPRFVFMLGVLVSCFASIGIIVALEYRRIGDPLAFLTASRENKGTEISSNAA